MHYIPRSQRVYRFASDQPPALHVHPGEIVVLETEDAGSHRITCVEDIRAYIPRRDYTNPATGPLFIEGALPGDTLAVEILSIEPDSRGYTKINPGSGLLIDEVSAPAVQIWQIAGSLDPYRIHWNGLSWPAAPMIGTIGVAPDEGFIENFAPGVHGGNLDVPALTAGATLHLPVFVPGALLALGDVHARQGDGEISGVALELRACVAIRVQVLAGVPCPLPWIENASHWVTIGIANEPRPAMEQATRAMLELLGRRLALSPADALMLLGVLGDMRPGQCMFSPSIPITFYLSVPKPTQEPSR